MSRRAKRRISDNIVAAHRRACENGQQELAHWLREALVVEVTGFGHGRKDRRRNADDVVGALDRHRRAFGNDAG